MLNSSDIFYSVPFISLKETIKIKNINTCLLLSNDAVIERLYQQIKLKKTNPEIVSGSDSEKVKPPWYPRRRTRRLLT